MDKPDYVDPLDDDSLMALHRAAYSGDVEAARHALNMGVNIDVRDASGYTALHWAADMGMVDGEREALAALLIESGADVNARENTGASVLMIACRAGNADIVRKLIAAGADVNAQDRRGATPLTVTIDPVIARMLLVAGANHSTMTQLPQHFEAQITKTARLDYLLYLPPEYESDTSKQFPLILFLHGMGERGRDLELVKLHGIPKNLESGQELPFIIVSPQCPAGAHWTLHIDDLNALLDEVVARYRVDESRIYLTGLSMGGAGTWLLAAAYPERFAAIAPICGSRVPLPLERLLTLPIWAFHGDADETVPASNTIGTVERLQKLGGNVKMTIYPGVGHDSWTQTYANPELYEWFLSH